MFVYQHSEIVVSNRGALTLAEIIVPIAMEFSAHKCSAELKTVGLLKGSYGSMSEIICS